VKKPIVLAMILVAAVFSYVAWSNYVDSSDAPRVAEGWRYFVIAKDIELIDNVVVGQSGEIFVSSEVKGSGGVVLQLTDGNPLVLLGHLSRPDGLAIGPGVLFITEEVGNGRVIQLNLDDRSHRIVTALDRPEGIEWMPNGTLVVAEDRQDGRIVRVTENGEVQPVFQHLNRPEGLTIDSDGSIVVAETGSGRILRITDGSLKVIVGGLNSPDQVFRAPDGAIWISEDATPGRLLRYRDGELEEVASGLSAPQGIAYDAANDRYLVAEQGRSRLLAFAREP
jgi:sugar lactone lactonase YvrE